MEGEKERMYIEQTRVLASCNSRHGTTERLGLHVAGRSVPGQAEIVQCCDSSYGWCHRSPLLTEFPLIISRLMLWESYGCGGIDPAADLIVNFIPKIVHLDNKDVAGWERRIVGAFMIQSRNLWVVVYVSHRGVRGWFRLRVDAMYDSASYTVSSEPSYMCMVTNLTANWGLMNNVVIWITLRPMGPPFRVLPNIAYGTSRSGPKIAP